MVTPRSDDELRRIAISGYLESKWHSLPIKRPTCPGQLYNVSVTIKETLCRYHI